MLELIHTVERAEIFVQVSLGKSFCESTGRGRSVSGGGGDNIHVFVFWVINFF